MNGFGFTLNGDIIGCKVNIFVKKTHTLDYSYYINDIN